MIPTPRPILPPEDSPLLEDEALAAALVWPAAAPMLAPDAELDGTLESVVAEPVTAEPAMVEPVMVGDCDLTVDDEVDVVLKRGVDVTVV